jgi:hypothetical protein
MGIYVGIVRSHSPYGETPIKSGSYGGGKFGIYVVKLRNGRQEIATWQFSLLPLNLRGLLTSEVPRARDRAGAQRRIFHMENIKMVFPGKRGRLLSIEELKVARNRNESGL